MAMTLIEPTTESGITLPPERILVFGGPGVGKTEQCLSVARAIPTARFFAVDSDYSSWQRMLTTKFQDVLEAGNVTTFDIDSEDWPSYGAAVDEAKKAKPTASDWLAVDSITPSWDAVQGWFSEQIWGKEIDEYFMEVRKKKAAAAANKKALGALDGWMDWPVINKSYMRLYSKILSWPGHIIMTAESAQISDEDDKDIKNLFGGYSVKPKGQKRLGHLAHTVLLARKRKATEWHISTIKDRGREVLQEHVIENFAQQYLVEVAGWKRRPARRS